MVGKQKIRTLRGGVFLTSLLLTALVLAQLNPQKPEDVAQAESQEARTFYQISEKGLAPAQFLDYIHQCARPLATYIQMGNKLYLRVYEFDSISPTIYRLSGINAITNAIRRAEVKARGSAVKTLEGTRVYVSERAGDLSINVIGAEEVSTSGGERAGTAKASSTQISFFKSITESVASGLIKGATVSGTKIISLGDAGLCVMVRLDVPLIGTTGPVGAPPSEKSKEPFNPGGAPPLPPGRVGDW